MTAPQLALVGVPVLARCPVGRCTTARRIDLHRDDTGRWLLVLGDPADGRWVRYPNSRFGSSARTDWASPKGTLGHVLARLAWQAGMICAAHATYLVGKTIDATRTNAACQAQCRTARVSNVCHCSCDGANHGADL